MNKEQIIEILKQWHEVFNLTEEQYCDLADAILSLPLEVPSDEEIEDITSQVSHDESDTFYDNNYIKGFKDCATWMRNEILKRNKIE